MLKLLRCEFAKLKRKPLFFAAAAISALIPLGCALFLPEMQEFSSGAEAVDRLMSTLFQLSAYLLLMPAVVVLASNLLFEEQDNDTLKNLMTVPVSKPALALAKMTLLFLFSVAFMAVGGLVNLAIVLASGLEPVGFWKLFFVGIGQGIMMWAGALPCVLLVVLLNRSYIISVIITFFYTAVNYIFGTNDYFIMQPFGFNAGTLLPGPLTFRWFFQYLDTSSSSAQMTELMERISPYFVTTPQAFLVVILESAVFLTLIALVYKRQSCNRRCKVMWSILKGEWRKLRRCQILLVGIVALALCPVVQYGTQLIINPEMRDQNFDFVKLFANVIWGNTQIFLPISLVMIGGWLIDRENTNDTMKNLLTVPVSYPKLLGGKLIVTIFLSILFGIYSVAVTVLTGTLAGLDGLSAAVLLRQGVQLVAAAFNTSLVCMPMILIFGQMRGAYLGGSLLTFFLGYCILFFKSGFLLSAYPFSAALILAGFDMQAYNGATQAPSTLLALAGIAAVLVLTMAILLLSRPSKKASNTKKKKAKKGRGRRRA